MPATLTMTAVPGHLEQGAVFTSKVVQLLGRQLGRETRIIGTVADVRDAVAAFGAKMRAEHPGESFAILVSIGRGDRKPRGFDAALRGGGFGQDAFLAYRNAAAA